MPQSAESNQFDRRLALLERDQASVRTDLATHKAEDNEQFAHVLHKIEELGINLGDRIDAVGRKVGGLELDKAAAQGRAEGVASVRAAINSPKPLLTVLVSACIAVVVAVIGYLAASLIHQMQSEIDALKNRPVASVTVSPAQSQPSPPPVNVPSLAPEPPGN